MKAEGRVMPQELSRVETRDDAIRVHIGHDFFGAGNVGDDLMLAGFLVALGDRPGMRITCCTPHDLASQRRRFPRIDWRPSTLPERRAAVADAHVWLGLGGSPFQSDDGDWFTTHLLEEAALCHEHDVPMDFLGVGVNDAAALRDPRLWTILIRARRVWARDARSRRLLAPHARVSEGADLAHVFLHRWAGSHDTDRVAPSSTSSGQVTRVGLCLNLHEDPQPVSLALARLLERLSPAETVGLAGEVRMLAQGERTLYSLLSPSHRARLQTFVPDYGAARCESLLAAWPRCDAVLSSRYHVALAQAWAGARIGVLAINDKLRGAAEELEAPAFESLDDVDLGRFAAVSRTLLEARANAAAAMIDAWVDGLGRAEASPRAPRRARVAVICPDSLGDLVLRQPLLTALVERGHEVTVAARAHVTALLPFIDDRLRAVEVPVNPYQVDAPLDHARALAGFVHALDALDLDTVALPCFNRTIVDEAVIRGLPHLRRVGFLPGVAAPFNAHDRAQLLSEIADVATTALFTIGVTVARDWHETRKCAAMAELAFDANVAAHPRLTLPHETRIATSEILKQLGLSQGGYAAVCPLGTANVTLKALPPSVTLSTTRALTRDAGLRVLLIGQESERADLEVLAGTLATVGVDAPIWTGGSAELGTLLGLLADARLYFGADTGPMHMAAALGIPVAAVFGGGTWPRFTPQAPHTHLTVRRLDCFGCSWSCPYPRPRCLDELDPAEVAREVTAFTAAAPWSPPPAHTG